MWLHHVCAVCVRTYVTRSRPLLHHWQRLPHNDSYKCCLYGISLHTLSNILALPISYLVSTKNVLLQVGKYLVRTRNVLLQVGECKQSPLKGKVTLGLSSEFTMSTVYCIQNRSHSLLCPEQVMTIKPCSKRVRVGRSFAASFRAKALWPYSNAWLAIALHRAKNINK